MPAVVTRWRLGLYHRLLLRGSHWSYRRRVPAALAGILRRHEIVVSLRTSRVRLARERASTVDAAATRFFRSAESLLRGRDVIDDDNEALRLIDRLAQRFHKELVNAERLFRSEASVCSDDDIADALTDQMERDYEATKERRYTAEVKEEAVRLLAGNTLTPAQMDHLHYSLHRARLLACRDCRREFYSDDFDAWTVAPAAELPRGPITAADPSGTGDEGRRLFSEVAAQWLEQWREGRPPKSILMAETATRRFKLILGDRPIGEYRKGDINTYRETLAKLPPRFDSAPAYKRKRIDEIIAANMGGPTIHRSTVQREASGTIGTLFSWAKNLDYIAKNPCEGFGAKTRGSLPADERDAFSDKELEALFGSVDLSRQRRSKPMRYWLPLLMLYTGARNEEIGGLSLSDIGESPSGVPYLEIRPDPDRNTPRRLKNATSQRTLPLHSDVISLGFLEYVKERKGSGKHSLFPDVGRSANGEHAPASRWFNRHIRLVLPGADARRKVAYSLRHTFATRLKALDTQEYVISELMGHKNEGMSVGRYGKRVDIGKLSAVVEKLRFPMVLEALKRARRSE